MADINEGSYVDLFPSLKSISFIIYTLLDCYILQSHRLHPVPEICETAAFFQWLGPLFSFSIIIIFSS